MSKQSDFEKYYLRFNRKDIVSERLYYCLKDAFSAGYDAGSAPKTNDAGEEELLP